MRKILLLLAITMCTALTASAEWKTSDTDRTLMGGSGEYGQSVLHSVTTPNGSTVVTWLKYRYTSEYANVGYYLYMQIYDKDGNALYPQEGKLVSGQATESWVTDYGLTCTDKGNILIAYDDTRSGDRHVHVWCFTEKGEPVWDENGVAIPAAWTHNEGYEMSAQIVASGENIYLGFSHYENYKEKATEDNWEPSPYFPDEEMPDSIDVYCSNNQVYLLNSADGHIAWSKPIVDESSSLFLYPAPEGTLYKLFTDENCVLYADRLNAEGENIWGESTEVFIGSLSSYGFLSTLPVSITEDGDLAIAMNVPNDWIFYTGITCLNKEGDAFFEPVCGNEDPNTGNSEAAAVATRGDYIFAAWPWAYSGAENYMWCNMIDRRNGGNYAWTDDVKYGKSLDMNDMWGMKAVKVIPQEDGWVVLYGNCTSWNGANFMVVKVSNDGQEMWRKQICEPDFKQSGMTVESDGKKAVIFYTQDEEYDDNWEPIVGEGGMFMMCVDITGDTADGIKATADKTTDSPVYYNINGQRLQSEPTSGVYLKQQNGKTTKIAR